MGLVPVFEAKTSFGFEVGHEIVIEHSVKVKVETNLTQNGFHEN